MKDQLERELVLQGWAGGRSVLWHSQLRAAKPPGFNEKRGALES